MAKELWIGDPCYVLPDTIYYDVWGKEHNYLDGDIEKDDVVYGFVNGTAYGDGCYRGKLFKNYCVDSGTLAILDLSTFEMKENNFAHLGKLVECDDDSEFSLDYNDGTFTFKWTLKGKEKTEIIKTA